MDNKLSELSKPVDFLKSAALITARNFERWSKLSAMTSESSSVLHSTTLLETAQLLSALLAELEAKDKRIAELELDELAMRASSRAVHEAQENHINQQQDRIDSLEKTNAGLGRGLAAAEQRLATPVRLPSKNDDEFWFDGVFQVAKFDRAVERAVRAACFTVDGDE